MTRIPTLTPVLLLTTILAAPGAAAIELTVEDLTRTHCHDHHPHHCDGSIMVILPGDLGAAFANVTIDNTTSLTAPWTIAGNASVFVNLSYVGGVNASGAINFTITLEDTGGIAFHLPQNVTAPLMPGSSTTRTYAFQYVKDMPAGDHMSPRLALGAPDHATWNETWVPLVAAGAPVVPTPTIPPVLTPTATASPPITATLPIPTAPTETPLGPFVIVAALVAAALLVGRRRQ